MLAKTFRDLGYTYCKTSRQASRLMDDCGVDLVNIPYNVQAKAVQGNINYTELLKTIKSRLADNLPKDDSALKKPIIIMHKKGRTPEHHLVVLEFNSFINIIKQLKIVDE